MGLFRRARGVCPKCGKKKQADIGEKHPKVTKWSLTCNGCGAKFTVKVDPAWWICFRDDNDRLRRRKIGQGKRAAGRILSKVQVEIAEGKYIDRKDTCKVTLRELKDRYTEHTRSIRRKWSRKSEASTWKRLLEFFGRGVLIDKIGERDIEAYRRKREGDGVAVATINRELSNLSGALTWAVRNSIIDKKPRVSMPNPQNEQERYLTKEEAKRLISYCPATIRPLVKAALFTGMRRSELLQMEWSWVDMQNGMIDIPPAATKNGRRRHVPISDNMHKVFEELKEQSVKGRTLVFHNNGKPIAKQKLADTWRKARDKAGLKGLRLHDARHSLASWLVMGGEDLYTVATILGHRSLKMAQRYSHLAPGHLRAAMRHADLDSSEKSKNPPPAAEKPKVVSMPNIMEDDHADNMKDGTPSDVKVGMLFKEGFGLNAILNEVVKQVLESNAFNKKATATELGISRSTLTNRMEMYRIPKSWPERIPPAGRTFPKGTTLKQAEEAIIRQALEENGYDKSNTARALGIARGTLASKMKRYNIAPAQVDKITYETPESVHQLFTSEVSPSDSLSEYARNPLFTEGKSKSGALPRAPKNMPHPTQSHA